MYICDGALGSIIPDEAGTRTAGTRRRDVDHGPALALLDEFGHDHVRCEIDALDVDVEDPLPFVLGDFDGRLFSIVSRKMFQNIQHWSM